MTDEKAALPAVWETMDPAELTHTLQNSVYPGAKRESVELVLSYCKAAQLNPLLKPVHIVPIWDKAIKAMRDVIMPGIGHYRIQATRTRQHVGTSEPEFGPDVTGKVGGTTITYPAWCRVTVLRQVKGGQPPAQFTAVERWLENYAPSSRDDPSPNATWRRRPYAQLAKCAEAQALRKAFPELGAAPTADEMEGREADLLPPDDEPATYMPKMKASVAAEGVTVTRAAPAEPIDAEVVSPPAANEEAPSADPMKDLPKATSGMRQMVKSKLTPERDEEAMFATFGFRVEDMPMASVNAVLTWARG